MHNYTNKELADAYFNIMATGGTSLPANVKIQMKNIAECPVNISQFYRDKQGLEELEAPGIRKRIRDVLERIIELGIERAIKEKQETFLEKTKRSWQNIPHKSGIAQENFRYHRSTDG